MKILNYLTLIILTINCNQLIAQLPIVTISAVDGTVDKHLPYDEPFILRIPYEKDKIITVQYLELINKKNVAESIVYKTLKAKEENKSFDLSLIPQSNIQYKKVEETDYAYVYFTYPNLLKPSKRYGIITRTEHSEVMINFFHEYAKSYQSDMDVAQIVTTKQDYEKIISPKKVDNKHTLIVGAFPSQHFEDKLFRVSLDTFLSANFSEDFNTIDSLNELIINDANQAIENLDFDQISLSYPNQDNAESSIKQLENFYRDSSEFAEAIFLWRFFKDTTLLKEIVLGNQIYLSNDFNEDKNTADRQANILKSINRLKRLYPQLKLLADNNSGSQQSFLIIDELIEILVKQSKHLNALNETIQSATNKLATTQFEYSLKGFPEKITMDLNEGKFYDVNSYIGSSDARNKLTIAPDLSFVSLLKTEGINPKDDLQYKFVPNLGFSINLQPINRDIKYATYDKTLLQQLTLDIGWSLVDFSSDSLAVDKVENFFNKNTLYTGMSFRLNNILRIQGGYQWLYITKQNLPRELKYIPAIGISVDLSIKDLINGFSDIVSGIRGNPKIPDVANN